MYSVYVYVLCVCMRYGVAYDVYIRGMYSVCRENCQERVTHCICSTYDMEWGRYETC